MSAIELERLIKFCERQIEINRSLIDQISEPHIDTDLVNNMWSHGAIAAFRAVLEKIKSLQEQAL